jgi:hypothetical protein
MPITPPTPHTPIDTTTWGIPITDAVNALAAGDRRGSVVVAADQAGIGAALVDLAGYAITFNVVAARYYFVHYTLCANQLSAASEQNFKLFDGAADLGFLDRRNVAAGLAMVSGFVPVIGLTVGAHTLKLRGATTAGTMNIVNASICNGRMAVVDAGT